MGTTKSGTSAKGEMRLPANPNGAVGELARYHVSRKECMMGRREKRLPAVKVPWVRIIRGAPYIQ